MKEDDVPNITKRFFEVFKDYPLNIDEVPTKEKLFIDKINQTKGYKNLSDVCGDIIKNITKE